MRHFVKILLGSWILGAILGVPLTVFAENLTCAALRPFNGRKKDASAALLECLRRTPAGGTLALPAGRYMLNRQIKLETSVRIVTDGIAPDQPRCSELAPGRCAEFRAKNGFTPSSAGFFVFAADNISVDHLVIDGNRKGRLSSDAAVACMEGTTNQLGVNILWSGNFGSLTNSVSRGTLCGSAVEILSRVNVVVRDNTVFDNGFHDKYNLWSDGITVIDSASSTVSGNLIANNTDVDLIFGGCQNCVVTDNIIVHNGKYESGSFAALMIHAWPNGASSGDYTGSEFSNNVVDCGPHRACGFGITVGSNPWYKSVDTIGVVLHHNTVRNAMMGLNVDPSSILGRFDAKIFDNAVTNSGGIVETNCGPKAVFANYNIVPSLQGKVDRSLDRTPDAAYGSLEWNCLPNYGRPGIRAFAVHTDSNLVAGQCLALENLELCLQQDGNLVLGQAGRAIWATSFFPDFSIPVGRPTAGMNCSACEARFQGDGNLVLYNPEFGTGIAAAYWSTRTRGNPGSVLLISPAGNPYVSLIAPSGVVIWNGSSPLVTPARRPSWISNI